MSSSKYTMDHLFAQAERMKQADTPKACNSPLNYSNTLFEALSNLPTSMSSKQIGLIMEALHAAYQLGQIRMTMLQEKERNS